MNANQIIRTLQIDRRKLARWIKAGLPHHGRGQQMTFDQSAVRRWLLSKGFAQIDKPIVVVNQQQVASHFGITSRQVRNWLRSGAPGRRGRYDLAAISDWQAQQQADELLLAGHPSPALERYRLARAKREEFGLERDLGQWLPRDQVHEALTLFANVLRQTGDALQRQFGPDAHGLLAHGISDALHAFNQKFGGSDGNQETLEGEDPREPPLPTAAPNPVATDIATPAAATPAAPIEVEPVTDIPASPATPPAAPTTQPAPGGI